MIRTAAVSSVFVLILVMSPAPIHAQDTARGAVLTGMSLDTIELTSPEARRALLRRRAFEPQPAPPYLGDRSIFYGARSTQVTEGSQVLLVPAADVPTLSEATFQAASWLALPDDLDRSFGEISHFAGGQDVRLGRSTVLPYDDVRIELSTEMALSPGDEVLAVRPGRDITGLGEVMVPTGILEVRRAEDGGVVARLVRDFSKVELGNEIHSLRTFPLSAGVYPHEITGTFSARVLAFEERKELYLPGDRLFIDAGFDDGLAIGDEFKALAGAADGWEGTDAATFQVVGLQRETATLRVIQSRLPSLIGPGLTVVMTRAMP
jgi:hypothetical protein